MSDLLNLIDKQKLYLLIENICTQYIKLKETNNLHSNVIDPFSALIESTLQNQSLEEWEVVEKTRQIQKTLQNHIGTLHEDIIGLIDGVEKRKVGNIVDIVSPKFQLIAEVKNKFNTTKGNYKVNIYDDIRTILSRPEYKNYIGYYVEIIPKSPRPYNSPFTPSDNTVTEKLEKRRPENSRIRVIDGKSFYTLLTGDNDAIGKIYNIIFQILKDQGHNPSEDFHMFFRKAYYD